MINFRLLALAGVGLFVSGCLSAPSVHFNTQVRAAEAPPVAIYFDQVGDIYPASQTPAEPPGLWTLKQTDPDWTITQRRVASNLGKQLGARLKAQGTETLVIMLHGYSNTFEEATDNYAAIRRVIENHPSGVRPVYLHVFWDGRKRRGLRQRGWGYAQYTGPLVGLHLRPVINAALGIVPSARLRVITHSSGAFIAAAMLGNSTNALPAARDRKTKDYVRFRALIDAEQGPYRPPQSPDIRVGLLAPATPPNSFAPIGLGPRDGVLSRDVLLIAGVSERDVATTKAFLSGAWSVLGSTALGSANMQACKLFEGAGQINANQPTRNLDVRWLDFSRSATCPDRDLLFWESHALTCYLQREAAQPFLDLLLNPERTSGHGRPDFCAAESAS